jgi:hypothetical protein
MYQMVWNLKLSILGDLGSTKNESSWRAHLYPWIYQQGSHAIIGYNVATQFKTADNSHTLLLALFKEV